MGRNVMKRTGYSDKEKSMMLMPQQTRLGIDVLLECSAFIWHPKLSTQHSMAIDHKCKVNEGVLCSLLLYVSSSILDLWKRINENKKE